MIAAGGVVRNAGVLVGMTCWCPAHADSRARSAAKCLGELVAQTAPLGRPRWDLIVVDNDVEHPVLRGAIATAAEHPWVTVLRLSPQRGWGGARNAQMSFFLQGGWSHLAMCDQDIRVSDPTWIADVEAAATGDDLHAFMLISDLRDLRGVLALPSGRLARVSREFLGAIQVVSRHAVERIGGYNTVDFPHPWGFHDCEYGLRLRAAGLLAVSDDQYIDPVMRTVVHDDTTPDDPGYASAKQRIVAEFHPIFLRRVVEIQLGQRLFHALQSVGDVAPAV